MMSITSLYGTVQRQSRPDDHILAADIIITGGIYETYGAYVDDECFDIQAYYDILIMILMMIQTMILPDDGTVDGERGNLYPIKAQGSRTLSRHE